MPRQIVSIVEGESLINDGTALVAYRVAVIAVVTGGFSLSDAGLRFVASAAGGIAAGLGVGYVVRFVRRRLDDPPVEITIALLTGYFAYLPAEMLDVSGVLAAVTVGVYVGWHAPELGQLTTATAAGHGRVRDPRLPPQRAALRAHRPAAADHPRPARGDLGPDAPRLRDGDVRRSDRHALRVGLRDRVRPSGAAWSCRSLAVSAAIGWMGMRGGVSLAAALAIPELTDDGAAVPRGAT